MGNVISAVRSYLIADTDTAALIGSRMFFDVLPQGVDLPAAIISRESERYEHELSSRAGIVHTRVSIECHSATRLEADAIARAMLTSDIDSIKGTNYGVNFRGVMIDDGQRAFVIESRDGQDDRRYVTTFDFMVSHTEI
jgi:hypothetical protein